MPEPAKRERQRTPVDWAAEQEACVSRVTDKPLQLFASSLGVSADSLRRLGVGLTQDRRAWTFPWYDAGGCVVGIQCQGAARRKWCVKGSRMELFLPSDNDGGRWLLICEGASDTAALLDRGFDAIGRASRAQGMEEACAYALDRDCVVVTDTDPEGIQDSSRFARMLKRTASSVRIVKPVCGAKDARAFGRSRAAWLTLIGNARPI